MSETETLIDELQSLVDQWAIGTLDEVTGSALKLIASRAPSLEEMMRRAEEGVITLAASAAREPDPELRIRVRDLTDECFAVDNQKNTSEIPD